MEIVIIFYSRSFLGQETAKGPFDLRAELPPVPINCLPRNGFKLSLFLAERQAEMIEIQVFIVFGLTRAGIEPKFTVSVADALPTRSLIGNE